jgi:hypothetical protein
MTKSNYKTWPERIFLYHRHEHKIPKYWPEYADFPEQVAWYDEPSSNTDIGYVRDDLHYEKIKELEKEIERLQKVCASYINKEKPPKRSKN